MERLTKRDKTGDAVILALSDMTADLYTGLGDNEQFLTDALNKLAAYEDAEEQGRLVVLPCKVGDRIYKAVKTWGTVPICCPCGEYGGMRKCSCLKEEGNTAECVSKMETDADGFTNCVISLMFDYEMLPDFGKTVFLSREEAEKALEGMGNNG
jgi:hypothetical protein